MNRLERAKREFHDWEREQDKSSVMYSKYAHECIAWILYEQITDMVQNNVDNEEIADFSRSFTQFADEVIEG